MPKFVPFAMVAVTFAVPAVVAVNTPFVTLAPVNVLALEILHSILLYVASLGVTVPPSVKSVFTCTELLFDIVMSVTELIADILTYLLVW